MGERIAKVDISQLYVEDQKHRLELDIPSLAESIQTIGQINPITVKKDGDYYRVIAGRRRYSALRYIQEELTPEKKVTANVYITDIDKLTEELITIDENIMRQQLDEIEFDEAIYRRKQIYEELHPDTKKSVAGGSNKGKSAAEKKKKSPAFTKDAAVKLNVTRRTIEKSVARAARASDSVKKARSHGLLQSKVDLLVTLEPKEQDLLLPFVKKIDLSETKTLIEKTKKVGAKAAVLYLQEERHEDPSLKVVLREAERLEDLLDDAIREEMVFRGDSKHESVKAMEALSRTLEKFLSLQKAGLGYVRAISRRDGDRKVIKQARA